MDYSQQTLSLATLPFDILTLIVSQLDLFDFMRMRLVSRDCHEVFTSNELCHYAITRLATSVPEAQVLNASKDHLDQLATRLARYSKKNPARIENLSVKKASASADSLAWGVAGDLLIYQTPESEGVSSLVIRDVDQKTKVTVDLATLNPFFDAADSWKVWIPKTSERGSDFLRGQNERPSRILVSGKLRYSEAVLERRPNKRSSVLMSAHTRALAIISLDEKDCGNIICHWTSDQEICHFVANTSYFVFVTEKYPHKYSIGDFSEIDDENKSAADVILTYAFPSEKQITSLGADYEGKRLYVGSGTFVHIVQIIDVKSGNSLKQMVMPMSQEDSLLQPKYEFIHAKEGIVEGEETTNFVTLCCSDTQISAIWKISFTARNDCDSAITSIDIKTHFLNSRPHITSKESWAAMNADDSYTTTSVLIRSSTVYKKSLTPIILINEYSLYPDNKNNNKLASANSSQCWQWPSKPSTLARLTSKSQEKHPLSDIPPPTVHNSRVVVGCGWMVFSKDRSEQLGIKNLYGRIGSVQSSDELVILSFSDK